MLTLAAALVLAAASNDAALVAFVAFDIETVVPPPGATVPTNARLALIGGANHTVNGEPRTVTSLAERGARNIAVLELGFADDATGSIIVACEGCSDAWRGALGDGPDTTPIAFGDGEARIVDGSNLEVCVPAPLDVEPFFWRVAADEGGDGDVYLRPSAGTCTAAETSLAFPIGVGSKHCFTITAIDVAGNETEVARDVCAFVEGASVGACTQASAPPLVALVALLALLGSLAPGSPKGRSVRGRQRDGAVAVIDP